MACLLAPLRADRATRLVAIVTSAGGLAALGVVLRHLPALFPAGILIVQHLEPGRPSHLAEILGWGTALQVTEARPHILPQNGHVYVAPPDLHLLVGLDGRLVLSRLAPLHFCRPSGDRLFASIALSHGAQAIAIVLTGMGQDGADGAQRVRRSGGTVIVQDEPSSAHAGMPRAAARSGTVDLVLSLDRIGPMLQTLVEPREAA